jgi:hypothetical protein
MVAIHGAVVTAIVAAILAEDFERHPLELIEVSALKSGIEESIGSFTGITPIERQFWIHCFDCLVE